MTKQEVATLNARVWPYAEVDAHYGPHVGLWYVVTNRVTGLDVPGFHNDDAEVVQLAKSIFNRYKGSE